MKDEDFVDFLQWALPHMGMRWPGFRKVRGQVKKRVKRRLADLELEGLDAYRQYLEEHPEEWQVLDGMTHITISRFYRDRGVWDFLRDTVLPELATEAAREDREAVRAWSAGCASGEEPYTLRLCWDLDAGEDLVQLGLDIVATDADEHMLERTRRACYPPGCLEELPDSWRERAFEPEGDEYCLAERFRQRVELLRQDIRLEQPQGLFELVLCRNLVLTYFDQPTQCEVLKAIRSRMRSGAALVVGAHEELPDGAEGFVGWRETHGVYRAATM